MGFSQASFPRYGPGPLCLLDRGLGPCQARLGRLRPSDVIRLGSIPGRISAQFQRAFDWTWGRKGVPSAWALLYHLWWVLCPPSSLFLCQSTVSAPNVLNGPSWISVGYYYRAKKTLKYGPGAWHDWKNRMRASALRIYSILSVTKT